MSTVETTKNYLDYKYVYFPAPATANIDRFMCVKMCPTETSIEAGTMLEWIGNSKVGTSAALTAAG